MRIMIKLKIWDELSYLYSGRYKRDSEMQECFIFSCYKKWWYTLSHQNKGFVIMTIWIQRRHLIVLSCPLHSWLCILLELLTSRIYEPRWKCALRQEPCRRRWSVNKILFYVFICYCDAFMIRESGKSFLNFGLVGWVSESIFNWIVHEEMIFAGILSQYNIIFNMVLPRNRQRRETNRAAGMERWTIKGQKSKTKDQKSI